MPPIYGAELFSDAARKIGYKPFPTPSANSSIAYTNPYGVRMGPCNLCGFCERFGCFLYSKASPQTTILPILADRPNLEVRTNAYVTRILVDSTGKKATGVLYIDADGREVEQPAALVMLCAFQLHNVRLLLLSKIGAPYDPISGEGVVGKNFAYQILQRELRLFQRRRRDQPVHRRRLGRPAGDRRIQLRPFRSQRPQLCRRLVDLCGGDRRPTDRPDVASARHPTMGCEVEGGDPSSTTGTRP